MEIIWHNIVKLNLVLSLETALLYTDFCGPGQDAEEGGSRHR